MSLKEKIIKAYEDGANVADIESDVSSYALEHVSMRASEQVALRCLADVYSTAVFNQQARINQIIDLHRGFLERLAFNLGHYFNRY